MSERKGAAETVPTEGRPLVTTSSRAATIVLDPSAAYDVGTRLMASRVRRRLRRTEGRDPAAIGKAVAALEAVGSLAGLSVSECGTPRVHARGTASPRRSASRPTVVGERSD